MPTYVFDRERGIMVDKATREPMVDEATRARPLQTPMTYSDLPGYRSPIDGSWIEGRRARAYDLQKNGCVDANDLSTGPRKLKNAKFAEKHGVTHLLER
jgi:hypothetical protein